MAPDTAAAAVPRDGVADEKKLAPRGRSMAEAHGMQESKTSAETTRNASRHMKNVTKERNSLRAGDARQHADVAATRAFASPATKKSAKATS
jgi:hypothetical protein